MKTTKLIVASLACVMLFSVTSCKKNSDKKDKSATTMSDNSKNSLDWKGVYSGVVPCADCEGIQTTIVLTGDSYELHTKYLGKDHTTFTVTGSFTWDDAGNVITFAGIDPAEAPTKYLVGENKLVQFDTKGNRMAETEEGKYTLPKVSNVVEKYWKLIEINGKEVVPAEHQVKEANMILRIGENRVNGNGGCNSFNGTYVIRNGNRISFSPMASTMMACMNMDIESQFFKALEMVDNYAVKGDTLSLNRARMAPLARFVAVHMD